MRFRWLAAAAALVVAGQAQAADYLTYDFAVTGTAMRGYQPTGGMPTTITGPLSGDIIFVMPTSIVGQGGATLNQQFTPLFAEDDLSWGATANALSITDSVTPYTHGQNRSLSMTACGSLGGAIPGAGLAIDPGCSAVSFFRGIPTANDGASFTGTVTGLTVTEGFGTPTTFGLIAAPVLSAVPEPATWAMTILGFGLAGTSLRRRRQRAAAAA